MKSLVDRESGRQQILDYTTKVLMGPGSEKGSSFDKFEIISESPRQRYVTGMLYPLEKVNSILMSDEKEELTGVEDDLNVIDNEFKPKTFGFTFYCEPNLSEIEINYEGAIYEKEVIRSIELAEEDYEEFLEVRNQYLEIDDFLEIEEESKTISLKKESNAFEKLQLFNKEKRDGKWDNQKKIVFFSYLKKLELYLENGGYVRKPIETKFRVSIEKSTEKIIALDGNVNVKLYVNIKNVDGKIGIKKAITIVVQNISKVIIYQNELMIQIDKRDLITAEQLSNKDLKNLDNDGRQNYLLYRNNETYAVGHGISVQWDNLSGEKLKIYTSYLPSYEVPQLKFELDSDFLKRHHVEKEEITKILQATSYLENIDDTQLENLEYFIKLYELWIDEKEREIEQLTSDDLISIALGNLEKCRQSSSRMKKSIQFLKEDKMAYKAFHWAQEAMILQRINNVDEKQMVYRNKEYDNKTLIWRPFQLAFILNSLESILNEDSEERMELDLIWVPTGGGKTEAYLFAIALLIFYRRLVHPNDSDGVSVIMRYTLRLLTAQQFERASSLICACEFIRNNNESQLGKTEISIGLWVGGSSTPNTRREAKDILKSMKAKKSLKDIKAINNFQMLKCPWCNEEGSLLPREKKAASIYPSFEWGIKEASSKDRHNFKCKTKDCHFHKNLGLPIYVVDDEIYEQRPTLLFGTVDKFARVPLDARTSRLFGTDSESIRNPELVIQDELHLISGPLGSIVGLYEAAFDNMLGSSGTSPKYIASTATIKNADEQVRNLFNRNVQQFPSAGIEADDNFFVTKDSSKPGRLYVGVMPTGKTQITTEIRLVSSLIQSSCDLDLNEVERDMYWTVTGYFNSIRELGKMTTLIKDDIDDYLWIMRQRNIRKKRSIYTPIELTSRIESAKIKDYMDQLEKKCTENDSVDILIATNMLSVGIDIDRLNSMFVVGQPKTTAEYIQATSRVGRKDPGLVWTLYNSTRSRDRSHYETFQSYHQSLYRYVESTSVTPYSVPALNKGLAAIMVAILRNMDNENLVKPRIISNEEMNYIKNYLVNRVERSEKDKNIFGNNSESFYVLDTEKKITQILDDWERMISSEDTEYYLSNILTKNNTAKSEFMLKDIGIMEHAEARVAMNSMRDVDQSAYVEIID
ncbi:helicase-related protein [Enterococcus avium]|uniref:helicase-related protein n=1 Tax=Enterococcus avium TaxID=33945 RepID=UPI001A96AD0E|nr:helicase-related protein [Enterococcus avium]